MTNESKKNKGRLGCEDIGNYLMDYLTHDLGPARSDLIREHLRKCPDCRAEARELKETIDLLRSASPAKTTPEHMSAKTRDRMMRAVTHPLLDWAFRHHIIISLLFAVLVLLMTLFALRNVRILDEPNWDKLIPVFIGQPKEEVETKEPPEPIQIRINSVK